MKPVQRFLFCLIIIVAVLCLGCGISDKAKVRSVITNELELLRTLDPDTASGYLSAADLFPDAAAGEDISDAISEMFSLFFRNFSYKIRSVEISGSTAKAALSLTTLDAHALARDFAALQLKNEIEAMGVSDISSEITPSNPYLLLNHLLKTGNYPSVQSDISVSLIKTGKTWALKRTASLEDDFVGGLISVFPIRISYPRKRRWISTLAPSGKWTRRNLVIFWGSMYFCPMKRPPGVLSPLLFRNR